MESQKSAKDSGSESFGSNCLYKKGIPLGKGAKGIVYIAMITERGDYAGKDLAAVKIVHLTQDIVEGTERCKKLSDRLRRLLELRNDHLVAYHKVSFTNDLPFFPLCYKLLMDYYSDGDLGKLLSDYQETDTRLGRRAAVCYTRQIADGLAYLHRNKLIHGDLKPENTLIKHTDDIHYVLAIGDLDEVIPMNRSATSTRDISVVHGTFRYMSPEMLKRFHTNDLDETPGRSTYVWSLGCVMLELASTAFANHERWLYNRNTKEKTEVTNSPYFRYVDLIIKGWVPFIPETIPDLIARYIEECLVSPSGNRPLVTQISEKLQKVLESLDVSPSPRADEPKLCFCKGRRDSVTAGNDLSQYEGIGVHNSKTCTLRCRDDYKIDHRNFLRRHPYVFGTTYHATLLDCGHCGEIPDTAIWVAKTDKDFEVIDRAQFLRFCNTLLSLKNKHIIIYDVVLFKSATDPIELMRTFGEYGGRSLNDILCKSECEERRLDCSQVICYALQLAEGLQFLDRNDIVHGSLYPETVYIKIGSEKHDVLVIDILDRDFLLDSNFITKRYDDCNSYYYHSPEILRKCVGESEEVISCKADIWSLGCLVLELAKGIAGVHLEKRILNMGTKERSFIPEGYEEFARQIFTGFTPYIPKSIPKFLAECIQKCFTERTLYRISSNEILITMRKGMLAPVVTTESMDELHCACSCLDLPAFADLNLKIHQQAHASTMERDIILHFHGEGGFEKVQVQAYEPHTGRVIPLPLPKVLFGKSFRPLFARDTSEIVCFVDPSKESGRQGRFWGRQGEIIACSFLDQTWEHVCFSSLSFWVDQCAEFSDSKVYAVWDSISSSLRLLDSSDGMVGVVPDVPIQNSHPKAKIVISGERVICCANDGFKNETYDARWIYRYDTDSGEWESLPDMPEARCNYALVLLEDWLYFLGGQRSYTQNSPSLRSCTRLNLTTLAWEDVCDLAQGRVKHGVFVLDGRIRIFGGVVSDDAKLWQTMESYDPHNNLWSEISVNNLDRREFKYFKETLCVPLKVSISDNVWDKPMLNPYDNAEVL